MISDHSLQRFSGALCIASIILCPLFLSRIIDFSTLIVLVMNAGIIFNGLVLTWGRIFSSCRWDGSVPRMRQIALLVIALLGAGILVFGISGIMPDFSPSGEPVSHLNAYFNQGKCFAEFNKGKAVEMPIDFCNNFNIHFGAGFCGGWLLLSSALHWASLMRNTSKAKPVTRNR